MKQEIDCALSTVVFVDDVIVTGASDGMSLWKFDTAEQVNDVIMLPSALHDVNKLQLIWIDSLDGHKIYDVRFWKELLVAVSLPGGFHSSTDFDFLFSAWRIRAFFAEGFISRWTISSFWLRWYVVIRLVCQNVAERVPFLVSFGALVHQWTKRSLCKWIAGQCRAIWWNTVICLIWKLQFWASLYENWFK